MGAQPAKPADDASDAIDYESDESLKCVYGEKAVFSRVGPFTLVHLDSPSDETVAERVAGFSPDEYFFDDCPLCEHARASGGHIVFDVGDDGESAENTDDADEPAPDAPA